MWLDLTVAMNPPRKIDQNPNTMLGSLYKALKP